MNPFPVKIKQFVSIIGELAIAAEFEVAESTVNRWISGAAIPHPRIQRQVLEWCEAWVTQREDG